MVEATILKDNLDPGDLQKVFLLLDRYAVLQACMDLSTDHIEKAKGALHSFPDNEWRAACNAIADYVVQRDL